MSPLSSRRRESLLDLAGSKPPAGNGIKPTKDGAFLYLDPAVFGQDFAGDLPHEDATFMARSQVFAAKAAFAAKAGEPTGKPKSWSIVATQDRSINPELERDMAKRAGSTVTEIAASHAVFASQPDKVADVIEQAARASSK